MLRPCWRQVATTVSVRSTNRQLRLLSVTPLIRRQITANRNACSAALFVGSFPLTLANVHRPSSTLRISKHVADVFTQPRFAPTSEVWQTSRLSRILALPNPTQSRVLSRTRCQLGNRRCVCFKTTSRRSVDRDDRDRSSPGNLGEDEPNTSVAIAPRSMRNR